MRYYAIIAEDGSGPAMGIGLSEPDAWKDAWQWGDVGLGDLDGYRCAEITGKSFYAILDGNPDAVDEVE